MDCTAVTQLAHTSSGNADPAAAALLQLLQAARARGANLPELLKALSGAAEAGAASAELQPLLTVVRRMQAALLQQSRPQHCVPDADGVRHAEAAALALAALAGQGGSRPSRRQQRLAAPLLRVLSPSSAHLEVLRRLGRGGFGSVCAARSRLDGRVFALKRVAFKSDVPPWAPPEVLEAAESTVLREVRTLAALGDGCPHVVQYYSAWLEADWAGLGRRLWRRRLREEALARDGADEPQRGRRRRHPHGESAAPLGAAAAAATRGGAGAAAPPSGVPGLVRAGSTSDDTGVSSSDFDRRLSLSGGGVAPTCVITEVASGSSEDPSTSGGRRNGHKRCGWRRLPLGRLGSAPLGRPSGSAAPQSVVIEELSTTSAEADAALGSDDDGSSDGRGSSSSGSDTSGSGGAKHLAPQGPSGAAAAGAADAPSDAGPLASAAGPRSRWPYVLNVAMELVSGPTLQEWMAARSAAGAAAAAPGTVELEIFRQLITGLAFIHARGIIHRDLKPANILLGAGPGPAAAATHAAAGPSRPGALAGVCVKIADFGLATADWMRSWGQAAGLAGSSSGSFSDWGSGPTDSAGGACCQHTSGVGTASYAAPEQLGGGSGGGGGVEGGAGGGGGGGYSSAVDLWSAGLVLMELFCRFTTGMERAAAFADARQGRGPPAVLERRHPQVASVVRLLLHADPARRPTAGQLLAHPLLSASGGDLRHEGGGRHAAASCAGTAGDTCRSRRDEDAAAGGLQASAPAGAGAGPGAGRAMYRGAWLGAGELVTLLLERDAEVARLKAALAGRERGPAAMDGTRGTPTGACDGGGRGVT